jgi:integrase
MFNLAVKPWGMRSDNPAAEFHRNVENEREVFLTPDQIGRLAAAIDAHENQRAADVVRLILLTGARKGEARTAKPEQFNLDLAIWTKKASTTKQKKMHRVPLSRVAVAFLRVRIESLPDGCEWLFPSDVEGQPIEDIRRFWADIQSETGLAGVRVHDLRHTFASLLVSGGMSLPMIGKLLGHSSPKTTQRYAHLLDDPLRQGVEAVGDMLRPKLRLVLKAAPDHVA